MGLKNANNKGIGGILRTHYERVVHPYVTFQSGKNARKMNMAKVKVEEEEIDDKDYVPHHIPSRMAVKPPPPSKISVENERGNVKDSFVVDKKTRRNRHYTPAEETDDPTDRVTRAKGKIMAKDSGSFLH